MTKSNERLLNGRHIPASLWDKASAKVRIPQALINAYANLIHKLGLKNLAEQRGTRRSPVGGISKEETDEHFAQAFDGSVARAQLALLDPRREVFPDGDTILRSLIGNELLLADAPCGAGAASISWLCTIAALREAEIFPSLPLDVLLVGAEPSPTARQYAQDLLAEVNDYLLDHSIFVQSEFLHWDALDDMSNAKLVSRLIITASDRKNAVLVVANFSGFLISAGKFKEAQQNINEMFRFLSLNETTTVWIEPNTKEARRLFETLDNLFKDKWKFVWPWRKAENSLSSEASFESAWDGYVSRLNLRLVSMKLRGDK